MGKNDNGECNRSIGKVSISRFTVCFCIPWNKPGGSSATCLLTNVNRDYSGKRYPWQVLLPGPRRLLLVPLL